LADRPFALIGANCITSEAKKLKAVMAKDKLPWRSFVRRDTISETWNEPGTPSYCIVDHRGIIRYRWFGNPGERAIDAALDTVIREAEKALKEKAK
jgi:hypothetical protein